MNTLQLSPNFTIWFVAALIALRDRKVKEKSEQQLSDINKETSFTINNSSINSPSRESIHDSNNDDNYNCESDDLQNQDNLMDEQQNSSLCNGEEILDDEVPKENIENTEEFANDSHYIEDKIQSTDLIQSEINNKSSVSEETGTHISLITFDSTKDSDSIKESSLENSSTQINENNNGSENTNENQEDITRVFQKSIKDISDENVLTRDDSICEFVNLVNSEINIKSSVSEQIANSSLKEFDSTKESSLVNSSTQIKKDNKASENPVECQEDDVFQKSTFEQCCSNNFANSYYKEISKLQSLELNADEMNFNDISNENVLTRDDLKRNKIAENKSELDTDDNYKEILSWKLNTDTIQENIQILEPVERFDRKKYDENDLCNMIVKSSCKKTEKPEFEITYSENNADEINVILPSIQKCPTHSTISEQSNIREYDRENENVEQLRDQSKNAAKMCETIEKVREDISSFLELMDNFTERTAFSQEQTVEKCNESYKVNQFVENINTEETEINEESKTNNTTEISGFIKSSLEMQLAKNEFL